MDLYERKVIPASHFQLIHHLCIFIRTGISILYICSSVVWYWDLGDVPCARKYPPVGAMGENYTICLFNYELVKFSVVYRTIIQNKKVIIMICRYNVMMPH